MVVVTATPTANQAPTLPPGLAPTGLSEHGWPANGRCQPLAPTVGRAPTSHQPLGGQLLRRSFGAFYLSVVLVAAAGQVSAAPHWAGWHLLGVIPLVAVLEFGGVVMAARADERRRMGERAYAALAISTAVAGMAAAINYVGHMAVGQTIAAWVFSGLTALGYVIWLVDTGYRRRDAMRDAGKMRASRPAYGWRWIKPRITLLALEIWRKDQDRVRRQRLAPEAGMSVDESWTLARVARVARREIRQGAGPGGYSDLTLTLYDLAKVAQYASARVDHEALAERIAERISVDAVDAAIARSAARHRLAPWTRRQTATPPPGDLATANPPAEDPPTLAPADAPPTAPPPEQPKRQRRTAKPAARGRRQAPTMDELVATLGENHHGEEVSLATAAATLRRVYKRCSDVRARTARDMHNSRLEPLNNDQESDGVAS
jgi:hypothetical protein